MKCRPTRIGWSSAARFRRVATPGSIRRDKPVQQWKSSARCRHPAMSSAPHPASTPRRCMFACLPSIVDLTSPPHARQTLPRGSIGKSLLLRADWGTTTDFAVAIYSHLTHRQERYRLDGTHVRICVEATNKLIAHRRHQQVGWHGTCDDRE